MATQQPLSVLSVDAGNTLPVVVEGAPSVDVVKQASHMGLSKGVIAWGWFGALLLWFIVFTVLFWLIYYSLRPYWTINSTTNQVDTAKVLLAAVITALIIVVIIWIIMALTVRR